MKFNSVTDPAGRKLDSTFETVQDQRGLIWVGTEFGLARYDGSELKFYDNDPESGINFGSNIIRKIIPNPDGTLWIGAFNGGVSLFDPRTERTVRSFHFDNQSGESTLLSNQIWSLTRDNRGYLWIGYFDGGVTRLNPDTEKVTHYRPNPRDPASIGGGSLNSIFRDSSGTLWFASYRGGLQIFDQTEQLFDTVSQVKESDSTSIIDDRTWAIAEDPRGALWIGTSSGIYRLAAGEISRPFREANDKVRRALHDGIRSLLFDSNGRLWIGTAGSGLILHWPDKNQTMTFPGTPYFKTGLGPAIIWDIRENKDGSIWLSHNNGVSFVDPRLLAFSFLSRDYLSTQVSGNSALRRFFSLSSHRSALYAGASNAVFRFRTSAGRLQPWPEAYILSTNKSAGLVEAIFIDETETVWIGTSRDGLYRKSSEAFQLEHLSPDLKGFENTEDIGFKTIDQIDNNRLVLGTVSRGIAIYDIARNRLSNLNLSLPAKQVSIVQMLSPDSIFIGTFSGASIYNLDTGTIRQLDFPDDNNSQFIHDILQIDERSWYVATSKGLYILQHADAIFTIRERVNTRAIPRNTSVLALEYGRNRDLWIGTSRGIFRFRGPVDNDSYAGLFAEHPAGDIARGTLTRLADGGMALAGDEGIETFPSDLTLKTVKHHEPVFSTISFIEDSEKHTRNIIGVDSINLPYSAQLLRIGFLPLDFLKDKGNEPQYAYRLKGLNKNWLELTGEPEAVFTNIPPGNFRFQVRYRQRFASAPEGMISIPVEIMPPWWQTWWAYSLYGLLVFLSLSAYALYYRRRLDRERAISSRLREADQLKDRFVEQLQEQVDTATEELRRSLEAMEVKNVELDLANRRSMEATQMKSEFLANISHEIRTPVGGIQGFLELLEYTDLTPEQKEYVQTIQSSAESLTAIVNDVLDVSKIEAGKLIVESVDFDILETLEKACQLLTPVAFKKQLELITIFDPSVPRSVRGDPTRFRQILTNLLGNAIKFTDEGSITVRLELDSLTEDEVRVCLAVTDTGIGISSEDRERLFQPYHQVPHGHRKSGTGLGLMICKKLVDLMGGEIRVHSTPGVGSTFEVFLPLGPSEKTVPNQPRQRLPEGRVAVVDEHPHAAEALIGTLASWHAEVIELIGDRAEIPATGLFTDEEDQPVVIVRVPAQHTHDPAYLHPILDKLPARDRVLALVGTMDQYILEKWRRETGVVCLSKSIRRDLLFRYLEPMVRETMPGQTEEEREPYFEGNETDLTGLRILVADDNRINRRLIASMVESHGAEIGEAETGPDVVVLAEAEDWDVILLDVHMPGLDGIRCAEKIRELPGYSSRALLIGISANALPETRKEALERGMDEYLVKPVREETLLTTIQSYPATTRARE